MINYSFYAKNKGKKAAASTSEADFNNTGLTCFFSYPCFAGIADNIVFLLLKPC
jgi:hypothetical protein